MAFPDLIPEGPVLESPVAYECSLPHTPLPEMLFADVLEADPSPDMDEHRSLRDRKSTRLNSSHSAESRMPSSA